MCRPISRDAGQGIGAPISDVGGCAASDCAQLLVFCVLQCEKPFRISVLALNSSVIVAAKDWESLCR